MRRTAAEAAETRRRALDAATTVLAERGYEGATFELIAARIGMTRGAVHHHFRGGKDELLGTLLREQWGRYGDVVLAPLSDTSRSPADRLENFLCDYLALLVDDPLFRALTTVTTRVAPMAASGTEQGVQDHRDALDDWRAVLRQVVDEVDDLPHGVTGAAAVFVLVTVVVGATDTAALQPDRLPHTDAERRAVARTVLSGLLRASTLVAQSQPARA